MTTEPKRQNAPPEGYKEFLVASSRCAGAVSLTAKREKVEQDTPVEDQQAWDIWSASV